MLLAGGGISSAVGQASGASAPAAATNGRIAFVLGKSAGKCHGSLGDLATANPDGSQCRVLTKTRDAEFPALNPAGDTIAFTRVQTPASPIYVIDIGGSGERELIPGPAYAPTWSPDGTEIAFAGEQSGSSQIYVADAQTGAILAQLTSGPGDNSEPAWSPDGTEIAFISDRAGPNRLYVMQADGTNQRALTQDGGVDFEPAWSPDGQRIAFANDQLAAGQFQIYQIRPDGTGESRVTHDARNDQSPSWSPDGRLIAFTSYSGTPGGNTIRLAPAPGVSISGGLPHFPGEQTAWAPLPGPSTPVPGVTITATPHGAVQVQPGGSSLAEPLDGPVSVPVKAGAPTIFRPHRGASVTLGTRLKGGKSSVITITGNAVAVDQPNGRSTRIDLMGGVSNPCPPSMARAAKPAGVLRWGFYDHGSAPPRIVHGYATLYFHGTNVLVEDQCRAADGLQQFFVMVRGGKAAVNGVDPTPAKRNGSACTSADVQRYSADVPSNALSTHTLQLLHSKSSGRFCARGQYSAATVRG